MRTMFFAMAVLCLPSPLLAEIDASLNTGRRWAADSDNDGTALNEATLGIHYSPIPFFGIGPTFSSSRATKASTPEGGEIKIEELGLEAVGRLPFGIATPFAKMRYIGYSRGKYSYKDTVEGTHLAADADLSQQGFHLALGGEVAIMSSLSLTAEYDRGIKMARIESGHIRGHNPKLNLSVDEKLEPSNPSSWNSEAVLIGVKMSM